MEAKAYQNRIAALFAKEKIGAYAALPYDACRVTRPYLAARLGRAPKTVILFLVPYYAGEGGNLSSYATARDYHHYMKGLFDRILPPLAEESGHAYLGFADHSPIDERAAAAAAGLGIVGENGLLIHKDYGSYVFIGEIITDAPTTLSGACAPMPPQHCEGCGACRAACPSGVLRGADVPCLSALTQKKGTLAAPEVALLRNTGKIWGCDICQEVCPHNRRAIEHGTAYTEIPFFREERIASLTKESLTAMSDEEFASRAFSFRGREPLLRNLTLLDAGEDT